VKPSFCSATWASAAGSPICEVTVAVCSPPRLLSRYQVVPPTRTRAITAADNHSSSRERSSDFAGAECRRRTGAGSAVLSTIAVGGSSSEGSVAEARAPAAAATGAAAARRRDLEGSVSSASRSSSESTIGASGLRPASTRIRSWRISPAVW